MADTAIQPLPMALGVNPGFVAHAPTFLVMTERASFSGDDFTIRDAKGADVLRCQGKVASMSGRKEFHTPQGQHLFSLRAKHFSIPKSWYLESPAGDRFCYLDGRFSIGKAKMDIRFKNTAGDGRDVLLEVRGSFFDRSADITWDGKTIAKIRRDFVNMREIFINRQTYGVEVAPGCDVALIAALVVGLDESQNEK